MLDFLSTQGLVESGVVDYVWGSGWRAPMLASIEGAQHGWIGDPSAPRFPLPPKAVLVCFSVHFRDVVRHVVDANRFGRYVVVVRDGDAPTVDDGWPACIYHVFGINVAQATSRLTPMPMAFHAFRGAVDNLEEALAAPRLRVGSVLVSHSLDMPGSVYDAQHERTTSIEYFRRQPWATVCEKLLGWRERSGPVSPWPWGEYAAKLREHDYLAVPIGYGTERIAQWEAMALGTIPICIRRPELSHFSDLPIALVDRWEDVTPEWCDANLGLIDRPFDKIRLSYWVDRIREKKAEL